MCLTKLGGGPSSVDSLILAEGIINIIMSIHLLFPYMDYYK